MLTCGHLVPFLRIDITDQAEIQGHRLIPYRNLNQLTKIIANLDIIFKSHKRKRIISI